MGEKTGATILVAYLILIVSIALHTHGITSSTRQGDPLGVCPSCAYPLWDSRTLALPGLWRDGPDLRCPSGALRRSGGWGYPRPVASDSAEPPRSCCRLNRDW